MPTEPLLPWDLLLSKVRRSDEPRITARELRGVDVRSLTQAGVIKRAASGDGFRHPECEHSCVHAFEWAARKTDGLVGVACANDPACWQGWDWLQAESLETYHGSASAVFAAVRERNGLAILDAKVPTPFVAIGTFKRSDIEVPVVWLRRPRSDFALSCSGVRNLLGGDGLIVVVGKAPNAAFDPSQRILITELSTSETGELGLTAAIQKLAPDRKERSRQENGVDMDDLHLRLAHAADRHVVETNGHSLTGFGKSDLNFLRLWLLAAARVGDPDQEHGGWVPRATVLGERSPDKQLGRLWQALEKNVVPDVDSDALRALVKTDRADGTIRLALHPSRIQLDDSLGAFDFLGPSTSSSKSRKRSPELERNVAQGLAEARRLLEEIEALGPRRPRSTGSNEAGAGNFPGTTRMLSRALDTSRKKDWPHD
jgi:hypothetical protein